MLNVFAILSILMGCLLVPCVWALIYVHRERTRLRADLARFDGIKDIEQHAHEQRLVADSAKSDAEKSLATIHQIAQRSETLKAAIAEQESQIAEQERRIGAAATTLGAYDSLADLHQQVEKQKQRVQQYKQVLGNFKTADELKTHIAQQTQRVQELNQTLGKFDAIAKLDQHIAGQRAQLAELDCKVGDLKEVLGGVTNARELHARISYQQNVLAELQAQAQQVEEVLEMQEFGFYRPRFDFESSSKYQQMIDEVRDQQKQMTKNDSAVHWEKKWIVEGSEAQGRKMMAEQTKLMLRAFNGECDAAVGKVKYNNATTMETRIGKSCEQINKLGKTNSARITDPFLQLKLQELYLVHEHRVKQQEEKEEQQRIRDQMREEERAQKEIEQAEEKASREEALAEVSLERARLAFERATQGQLAATEEAKAHNAALAAQVTKLENELKAAIDRKAKAIARAQLTKSGHVYVLSNIGSFGETVYKLGMTRRLEILRPCHLPQGSGGGRIPPDTCSAEGQSTRRRRRI